MQRIGDHCRRTQSTSGPVLAFIVGQYIDLYRRALQSGGVVGISYWCGCCNSSIQHGDHQRNIGTKRARAWLTYRYVKSIDTSSAASKSICARAANSRQATAWVGGI